MQATFEQAFRLTCRTAQRQWACPHHSIQIAPLHFWGPPGIGKSSVPAQAAQHLGVEFIDIRLSQYEPTDLRGLPVPVGDLTRWLPSSELPWDPATRGILMLDELTSADRSVQAAAYQLVLDRKVGQRHLSDGWIIVAASNRCEDQAIAYPMSSALANRFCHVELAPDLDEWIKWATLQGLSLEVIAFLRFRPERFFSMEGDVQRGWPSPRSWERVARSMATLEGGDMDTLELEIEGLVGQATAVEFAAFRKSLYKLPNPVDLLLGKAKFRLPARADQKYALCTGLAWHLWRVPCDLHEVLGRFLEIGLKLPPDFAMMTMTDAIRQAPADRGTTLAHKLFAHPRYRAWANCHQAPLAEALV